MGQREFLLAFYKSPKLIHEIFEFWENFLEETMEEVANAKVLDYVVYWEDMCYKNGPQISPRHFEEFMLPYYKRFSNWLRRKGINIIMVDTDGDANQIMDQFLEGGVNCMFPLEVASYMDAVELRKKYGKRLSVIGNIDKMAIAKGKAAIDRELDRKIPLTKEGGFLPCVDHNVSPDISLRNYTYYVQSLKEHLSIK
jgi:uroporphyrinogen decarboxylase